MPGPIFEGFSRACNQLPKEMEYNYGRISASIEYSNTERQWRKHFSISLVALVKTLKDILQNIEIFLPHARYDKKDVEVKISAHVDQQGRGDGNTELD